MLEPEGIVIRRAVPGDAEELSGLAARTFRDTFAADNRPEDLAAHLSRAFGPDRQLAEIADPGIRTLVAADPGGALIAFAQLRTGTPPACVVSEGPIELWRFYVDRDWHGRGLAQRLMQAVLAEAGAAGARSAWLGVWERNPRAASFYRKCGFVDVGAHEFRLGDDVQVDRVMTLALPGAADG